MVRDPEPGEKKVRWQSNPNWWDYHRVFLEDIALVTSDVIRPWTLPNVNFVPSREYARRARLGPHAEPIAAKNAMPCLGEGPEVSPDGMFVYCLWGLPSNRGLTHVFNYVYRQYSTVYQSDLFLVRDYYEMKMKVLCEKPSRLCSVFGG